MNRISKENYYLDIAQTVLERATCLRRVYGAIIVKNDEIISTGYNGAPRGRRNCVDMGFCTREALKVPRGERYELCRSVHAEANAIIAAPSTNNTAHIRAAKRYIIFLMLLFLSVKTRERSYYNIKGRALQEERANCNPLLPSVILL